MRLVTLVRRCVGTPPVKVVTGNGTSQCALLGRHPPRRRHASNVVAPILRRSRREVHSPASPPVNVEGFRPCLSKPSYGAPQWALMVRLMQKERLKSPHKSLFYVTCTGPFWSFWSFLENIPFLAILASHFRTRIGLPKKSAT